MRDGLSYNTSLRLWLEYVLASVQDSQSYPRVFVTYDELLNDWRTTVTKMAQTLKIEWTHRIESVAGEIEAFLNPTLKHHHFSPTSSDGEPARKDSEQRKSPVNAELLAWCNTVYQALCHVADGNRGQLEVLNSVSTALHRSQKMLQQSTTPSVHLLIHLPKKQQKYLKNTLAALRCQDYRHWYLSIIADFSSTDTALWDIPNIRWLQIESNRQATATINREIAVINAEWVALIAAGDSFAPHLLSLCVQQFDNHPSWQLIYVDEDSLSVSGECSAPQFKPDFNLDLLRAMPYMGSFCLIRREAQQAVGGYAPYLGLENYDIALKIWEQSGDTAIGHIAKVLYHRLEASKNLQSLPNLEGLVQNNKPRTTKEKHGKEILAVNNLVKVQSSAPLRFELRTPSQKNLQQEVQSSTPLRFELQTPSQKNLQQKILQQHLQRQRIRAKVHSTENSYWIEYALQHNSLVSIIIATRNGGQSLQRCLTSLLKITAYTFYEMIVVDNHSDDVDTLTFLESLKTDRRLHLLFCNDETNSSEINNLAAKHAHGDYLLFLNDDTEIIQAEWLQRLLALNQRQKIGIVVPRLLDAQRCLLHAGFILGMGNVGIAGQINQGLAANDLGYMGRAQVTQNFSAVSDNCLMIRKSVYQTVGGMDTEACRVLFNEVDLCLKVGKADYKIVWTPHVTLLQYGSGSLVRNRQQVIDNAQLSQEIAVMYERGLPQLCHDPAYNPNLCLNGKEWQPETQINVPWVISNSNRNECEGRNPEPERNRFFSLPRIVAFPYDAWGCGEYRVRAPLRALQQTGMAEYALMPNDDVRRVPTLTELERMQANTLLLHNTLHDEHLNALQHYRRFNHCFKVFGQDDLIYALPKTNPYYQTNYKDIKNRVHLAISLCDRLIVTTEPLADAYHHLAINVQVIPNYIASAHWENLSPLRQQGRKPRVGWAGAAQHQGDLKLIVPLVKALAPEVEWIFFGLCPEELRAYIHECYGMVPFEHYPTQLANLNLDLAIAPLEQNAFNEAKSNLRLLEHGILGYPVVCSDIYPYQNAPVKRVANTEQAWIEAVRERIYDLEATAKEGNQLKQWVINNWLLENHLTKWGRALNVMATHKTETIAQSDSISSISQSDNISLTSQSGDNVSLTQSKPRWIFILGCEHSGTNLLAKILCQHESIALANVSMPPLDKVVKIPLLWTEKEALLRAKTSEVFKTSEVYQKNDTHLLAEGLPANMGRALWLQQLFPDAYFILMVRNGYAVALDIHDSVQQKQGITPLLLHRAARQWLRSLEILQENAPKLQHFLEIRYEDLLDKPSDVTGQICNFLNLKPLDAEVLTNYPLQTLAYQHTERLAQMSVEQQAVIKNCVGNGNYVKVFAE